MGRKHDKQVAYAAALAKPALTPGARATRRTKAAMAKLSHKARGKMRKQIARELARAIPPSVPPEDVERSLRHQRDAERAHRDEAARRAEDARHVAEFRARRELRKLAAAGTLTGEALALAVKLGVVVAAPRFGRTISVHPHPSGEMVMIDPAGPRVFAMSAVDDPDDLHTGVIHEMVCPRCGVAEPDFDGFGMLAHTQPAYEKGCGYCSHPSRDGDGEGNWTCNICGDVRRDGNGLP